MDRNLSSLDSWGGRNLRSGTQLQMLTRDVRRREAIKRHNKLVSSATVTRSRSAGVIRSGIPSERRVGTTSLDNPSSGDDIFPSYGGSTPTSERRTARDLTLDSRAGASRYNDSGATTLRMTFSTNTPRTPDSLSFDSLSARTKRQADAKSCPDVEANAISRSSSVTERPSSRGELAPLCSSSPSTPTSFNRISPVRDRYTFTGHTYSYVGQSPASKQSTDRPNAARKTRSSSLKMSPTAAQFRDVQPGHLQLPNSDCAGSSQKQGQRKASGFTDQFERSGKGVEGLYNRSSFTPRFPLSNIGTGSRGVPHALLTDMQLFRKLYMNQLEKEARREVEEQYAKNKQAKQNEETHKTDVESVTPTSGYESTFSVENPSPRMSILKQPKPSQIKSSTDSAPSRKRVSFSADILPGMAISSR